MNRSIFNKIEPELLDLQIFTSNRKNKKYYAIVNGKKLYFGDKKYQQYKDRTGLGAFKSMDHGDNNRRLLYYARHGKNLNDALAKNKITSVVLSSYFLW